MWETMFESHAAVDQGATAVVHNTGSRASLHPWTSLDPWALTLPPSLLLLLLLLRPSLPRAPGRPLLGGGEERERKDLGWTCL
ncbi:hypothetical protein CGMCC3_g15669 [Colletotrichum fructicola]|nr:uncharacterized protein CGMCC3_g15669 [Colletotrichum fructicola]KAE9568136.1 hypothetical protein CGMCC3_g15669 [Colletotrichum fructicola]